MNLSDLLKSFTHARVLREWDGDVCYCDPDHSPHCGSLSLRESVILYNAVKFRQGIWCEIGSHVGWSAAVMSLAGSVVVMVDPEYREGNTSGVRERMLENVASAKPPCKMTGIGRTSDEFFAELPDGHRFEGFHIDGDHSSPIPLRDAENAASRLKPGGVIVMHDTRGDPVKDALNWLRADGFTVIDHPTMNGIAVCRKMSGTYASE